MHKLVIQIEGINNNKKSPLRKIIHQQNDKHICEHNSNESEFEIKETSNRNEKKGIVHLYKKYDGSIKQAQIEQKSSLSANQIQIKTQVIFFNRFHSSQLKSLMAHIQQRQSEIDFFDMIWDKEQQNTVNIVIYFNSILTSQEFFQLSIFKFHTLAIYIKQTIIISKEKRKTSKQLLKYAQLQQQLVDASGKDLVYTQKWVQIPLCITCLQKLEYEITGIPIQFLHQIKDINKQCKTCETILKINQNEQTNCQLCQSTQDNWICMVCNKIGCGRYKNADAFKHFQEEGHIITLDLYTQRVWNYMSDCFSHRVIPLQKEEVTLRFPQMNNKKNVKYEQSLQNAFWEYCSVVSEELQRQRKYYQKQKNEQQEKFKKQNGKLDNLMMDLIKQVESKDQTIKKIYKKNNKNQKRLTQLRQKIKMDRQTLTNYQKMIKQQNKQQTIQQIQKNSPKIQQKLKIKSYIQKQIQSILMKLSQY